MNINEILQIIFTVPIKSILTFSGIGFLLIAIGVNIKDKIEPDKWGRIGSLAIGAILMIIGFSSAQMEPPERGIDRLGGDYGGLNLSSAKACSEVCALDDKCRAFTFGPRPGESNTYCWLKDSVPDKKPNESYTSGVKVK